MVLPWGSTQTEYVDAMLLLIALWSARTLALDLNAATAETTCVIVCHVASGLFSHRSLT